MKYAAHDEVAVYAIGDSQSQLESNVRSLEEDQHVELEYSISECTDRFYRYVLENGTPYRWITDENDVMDLDVDEDEDEDEDED